MNNQTRTVRALVVENDEWQLKGIKSDLDSFPADRRKQLGICHFECHEATSKTEAETLLANAKEEPYDFLILDLSLPLNKGELEESPKIGLELLNLVKETGSAKEIIVVSQFQDYENVSEAFRGGALDFIGKPYRSEVLQKRVLECWKRMLKSESNLILEKRIKELIPYYGKGLAHQFSGCFSRFIQTIAHTTEEVAFDLSERRLEMDSKDSLVRRLHVMEQTVQDAKQEWKELNSTLFGGHEETRRFNVEDLVCQVKQQLQSCLLVKGVELEFPQTSKTLILSFREDVFVVLKEIVAGALSEPKDYNDDAHKITVSIKQKDNYAQVSFSSGLFRIDPAMASSIEKGERQENRQFDQLWGLSIAQYIALCGGGRLRFDDGGTLHTITYLLPMAS